MCASSDQQLVRLQDRLGYRFSDPALLRQAMIHRSYLNESTEPGLESNERLEFLGDAILGAVVAQQLYADFPGVGEGWLTVVRSRLVRNSTLGQIGQQLGLSECLLMGAGVANEGGRERFSVLGRVVEATIGAIWLDGGEEEARRAILNLLDEHFKSLEPGEVPIDPKSRLQHVIQAQRGTEPRYVITHESGPPHDRSFRAVVEVEGANLAEGEGRTKRAAEMEAARIALDLMMKESA
ncbi:MAG: ribonuclease III [Chloroflexi bacterium]|nr:ribonuclease III [Chloroflexota bacterium]MYJ57648.1 ribonuclease III [Chloroflexota bacterium]